MSRARFLASVGTALLLSHAGQARGDDNGASTALFNAGRDLMRVGNYGGACPKLEESVRLRATVGGFAKLAECEEHEGHLASAYGRWQLALNLARSFDDPRAPEVESELARVGAVVPKLRLAAAGPLPANAEIHVDQLTLGVASLGVDLAVDPGEHPVSVRTPGKMLWSTTVHTMADGATTVVTIPVESVPANVSADSSAYAEPRTPPAPEAPAAAGPPAPAQVTVRDARATLRTASLVAGGAGVLALGVGLALAGAAIVDRNAAGCSGAACPTDAAIGKYRDAQGLATASEVTVIAGGAAAAGAMVLWLWPSTRARTGVRALPAAGPHDAGLWVSGAF